MPLLTLDRIVSGRAVLVDEEGNGWEVPSAALPADCKEGDLLDARLRKRKGAGRQLEQEIQALQDKLRKLKKI